ncbi:zinc-dependent alcohol dehydrogenase [Paenibacillus sacheonensis]|uniref:Alcohol dehydrogenase catalytic domain-containing protein n=1 Tax=Paenibacillus sacheonensis TaxID=742054 RepID=A0A7X5C3F5_9BACL|nr:alcohol dehydrogenase catalytic domain-containing protein [Paenibacillus sacheonensis]MBM7567583.1 threonine dehydrogenase-like Zn-dependent dehydrogenase [Paenibacillus sacheonensis]NBC71314.1 alcohol dehydrogenase catalytic domain-containing protein [Paenibacillus sacheonensis]
MRAIVWQPDGRLEEVADWPAPAPAEDEALVRVRAAGICSTDLHMVSGRLDFAKPPWVLGHEIAGSIERVGSRVVGWQAGDRVVVDPVIGCGSCRSCLSGRKYLCPDGGEIGTTTGSGGYGAYVAVKPGNLYRLPDALSYEEGAMMEPLNCTLGAIDRARNIAGARVAVFGGGPAGQLFAQLAHVYGAASVTLFDKREETLALGLRLGADEAVHLSLGGESQYGAGAVFDVVVEASGSVDAVRSCLERVAPGGTIVLYGLNGSDAPSIPSDRIVAKDLGVVTCISAPLLWDRGIRLVESGRVDVGAIVSDRVPFGAGAAFLNELTGRKRQVVKAMLIEEGADGT